MSQGGSALHPTPRHSSQSPAADSASSPPTTRQNIAPNQDVPKNNRLSYDASGSGVNEGSGTSRQSTHRPSAVHNILNPSGEENLQSTMGTAQYGTEGSPSRQYVFPPGQGASTPQQRHTGATTSPAGHPSSGERGSPHGSHQPAMAAVARRILTPKSPRANLSRAALRNVEPQHQQLASLQAPTPRSSTPAHDISSLAGPPLPSSHHYHPTLPPSRPTSGLSRSLSQPSLSQGFPVSHSREPSQSIGLKREHTGQPVYSIPPYAPPIQAHRPVPQSGYAGDGRWPQVMPSSLSNRAALHLQEGQTMLTITPRHGEEILVPVDIHQASKQADEKRQRNAGASARFRQRKKEREREQQQGLQKLENRSRELEKINMDLEKRCRELESEREFYRNERNRLRDIVLQTPSIREWAERAPPSPVSSKPVGSYATESNTLATHQSHAQPPPTPTHSHSQSQSHPPSYSHPLIHPHPRPVSYSDPSILEPPLRRRRTDSEPQPPTSSFALSTPTTLPPITGPPAAFGIPPSPHITPPPGPSRLPPLRFDQARPSSITPPNVPTGPPPPSMHPPTSVPYSHAPYRKTSYETAGWVMDPRGPPGDGKQR
ncbi:hypothetical protein QBC38DRAFT_477099 [Podospora fimiseda]|uniref:BZIP domain-containing protein n=1 Tax=Podospora fimiseda TaxID=252190 RepID=A0AAN7BQN7_9PEZI|nr:hypothetical protein QBC38DRAFT_477099 [Podospora fimiseda]